MFNSFFSFLEGHLTLPSWTDDAMSIAWTVNRVELCGSSTGCKAYGMNDSTCMISGAFLAIWISNWMVVIPHRPTPSPTSEINPKQDPPIIANSNAHIG